LKIVAYFLFVFTLSFSNLFAQENLSREKVLFEKSVHLYKSGNFKEAEKNFSIVVERLPNSKFITSNILMLAKTQYKLENYTSTINLTKNFMSNYPKSRYMDDILLVQGDCYYRLNRYESAVNTWLTALETSTNRYMTDKLKNRILSTLTNFYSQKELENLAAGTKSNDCELATNMAIYIKGMRTANNSQSKEILMTSINRNASSKFYDEANELIEQKNSKNSDKKIIALLLPMTGGNSKIAQELQEGIEFALSKFNSANNTEINIIVKDYGQDLTSAIITMKEIAKEKDIIAVYGPIENDFAAACAVVSEYESIPLFSPTASGDDLTMLSRNFYQLNNPLSIQAESLAKFAMDSLGLKRFATFAPIDDHFVRLIDKFSETCQENGGMIVGQEWYYPGEQDFFKKFMKIKQKGLKLVFSDSVLAVEPDLSETQIDSLYGLYIKSEMKKTEENFVKIDSADIPVNTIDGLFVPLFGEDLKFVAPQIAYSNIQAQILGNGDWYNPDELKKNRNYIEGVIFSSDGYLNEEDWDYKKFKNDYRVRLNKTPTLYNLVGFDTFNYILQYLKDLPKEFSRNKFIEKLKNAQDYKGLYRKIKLKSTNYNSNVQIIKYKYNQILPIN